MPEKDPAVSVIKRLFFISKRSALSPLKVSEWWCMGCVCERWWMCEGGTAQLSRITAHLTCSNFGKRSHIVQSHGGAGLQPVKGAWLDGSEHTRDDVAATTGGTVRGHSPTKVSVAMGGGLGKTCIQVGNLSNPTKGVRPNHFDVIKVCRQSCWTGWAQGSSHMSRMHINCMQCQQRACSSSAPSLPLPAYPNLRDNEWGS